MISNAELDAIKREAQRVARLVIGPDDISPTTQLRLITEVEELRAALRERDERIATEIVREVAELPDRNSPDDQPDMMLVTQAELTAIIKFHIAKIEFHIAKARAALGEKP